MKRELIFDRTEENTAVLTDKSANVLECDAGLLPAGVREGDALYGILDENSNILSIEVRKISDGEKNRKKLSGLFAMNPKNNITEQ